MESSVVSRKHQLKISSEAFVKKFCRKEKKVTDNELQNYVAEISKTVGYTNGRKTMII